MSHSRPISTGHAPQQRRPARPAVLVAFLLLAGLAGTTGASGGAGAALRSVGDDGARGTGDGRWDKAPGQRVTPDVLPSGPPEAGARTAGPGRCRFSWKQRPVQLLRCATSHHRR
ncbi:hypothetical protein [Actinomadura rugatobispora]|uniref:hypothetical protein n=1 Tax=Actinomadura rugatobispora TaxID=1994 RepID=UPI00366EA3C0